MSVYFNCLVMLLVLIQCFDAACYELISSTMSPDYPEVQGWGRLQTDRAKETRQGSVWKWWLGCEQETRGGADRQRHRGRVEECPADCREDSPQGWETGCLTQRLWGFQNPQWRHPVLDERTQPQPAGSGWSHGHWRKATKNTGIFGNTFNHRITNLLMFENLFCPNSQLMS